MLLVTVCVAYGANPAQAGASDTGSSTQTDTNAAENLNAIAKVLRGLQQVLQ